VPVTVANRKPIFYNFYIALIVNGHTACNYRKLHHLEWVCALFGTFENLYSPDKVHPVAYGNENKNNNIKLTNLTMNKIYKQQDVTIRQYTT